jgi:hypothetical protein
MAGLKSGRAWEEDSMDSRQICIAAASALAATLGLAGYAQAAAEGGRPLSAAMSGAAEKPNPGDPDAKGTASVRVNVGQSRVCYDLQVSGLDTITMAHIHKAPADAAGPVVVPLTAPGADGKSSGCAKADKAVVQDILQNPSAYYVNVHTQAFPAGALRGQLSK